MEIGIFILAVILIPVSIFFLLPRHLRQRLLIKLHFLRSDFGDRLQTFGENWQTQGLNKELLDLLGNQATASRLLDASRKNNPGKSQKWHLEKIIYDLKRGR